jgi:hypothetical protein
MQIVYIFLIFLFFFFFLGGGGGGYAVCIYIDLDLRKNRALGVIVQSNRVCMVGGLDGDLVIVFICLHIRHSSSYLQYIFFSYMGSIYMFASYLGHDCNCVSFHFCCRLLIAWFII